MRNICPQHVGFASLAAMMFLRSTPLQFLALTAVFWLAGCSDESTSSTMRSRTTVSDVSVGDGTTQDFQDSAEKDVDAATSADSFLRDQALLQVDAANVEHDAAVWQPSGEPDLVINLADLESDVWFDEIMVTPESCAYREGCVDDIGLRRLVRFSVSTGNIGETDYILGDPTLLDDQVEFSPCHEHYHYTDYANYELRQGNRLIRVGHKQAFCLMDIRPMSGVDPASIRSRARYNCRYQGISAGWEDVYGSDLDCQWIDITDVAPGTYALAVEINPQKDIKERTFENNTGVIDITIPSKDLTQPCSENAPSGLKRHCGWERKSTLSCSPGALLQVGGGGCYGLGRCTGTPVIRLCDASIASCSSGVSLAQSDAGCGESQCPHAQTICPGSGLVDVWVNLADADADRIVIESTDEPIRLDRPCEGGRPRGLQRLCGWSNDVTTFTCAPGRVYAVGCDATPFSCAKPLQCTGDPMLRVCETTERCTQADAIAESDDACGGRCPHANFTCPAQGHVKVIRGAFDANEPFSCDLSFVLQ